VASYTTNMGSERFADSVIRWLPVILGILVLYMPSINFLANNLWNTEEQAHGPIILLVVFYLFWQHRSAFSEVIEKQKPILGAAILALGLLIFAIGRSQEILFFEIGSLLPVLTGIALFYLQYS